MGYNGWGTLMFLCDIGNGYTKEDDLLLLKAKYTFGFWNQSYINKYNKTVKTLDITCTCTR